MGVLGWIFFIIIVCFAAYKIFGPQKPKVKSNTSSLEKKKQETE
jgi:hypothetical protein